MKNRMVFFSIPAYGHTNPTIEVVRQLVQDGNEVIYYSFNEFKERIEAAGARCICCDEYLRPKLKPGDEKRIGKDFSFLMEMVVETTLALDEKVCRELKELNPHCIISDSVCFWGKLFAQKLNVPYICSTTTFAFNDKTARLMKRSFKEIIPMILGMGTINKKMELLRQRGYDVKNFISLISNNNDTNTIVYTSKEFQPMAETFSDKFYFIGPSVSSMEVEKEERKLKRIYISMGTVNNKEINFYKDCIKAFENTDIEVIMSVGKETNLDSLGDIPDNFKVYNTVNQVQVLQNIDVFITHCGMNSVNESLYYGVPMVLFPQHSEQRLVAERAAELGTGVILKNHSPKGIRNAVFQVLGKDMYKKNAQKLACSFKEAGGVKAAVKGIYSILEK